MSQPPTSSPPLNSCGIVGHSEIAESSSRMRGSGRMSTAANGTSSDCSVATVRAENPQAGASGVPFMKRITSCSAIASWMASRIGLLSAGPPVGAATGAEVLFAIGIGSNWVSDIKGSCPSGGLGLGGGLGPERERVDRPAEVGLDGAVDELVLLDAAQPLEHRCSNCGPEVVAGPGRVLDLCRGARERRLDALFYVRRRGHR